MIEHHSRGQNLGRGVSDILASDIGRGAVRRLEDGAVGTDVGTRSHTQSTYQTGAQVAHNVTVQVGSTRTSKSLGFWTRPMQVASTILSLNSISG